MDTGILKVSPIGWWFQDDRNGSWFGPFPTEQAALGIARTLVPEYQEEINLLQVAPWERKTVPVVEGSET